MNDDTPTCRPCGIRGKVTYATWVLNITSVEKWYLCDYHSGLIGMHGMAYLRDMTQLPNAQDIRERNMK